MIPGLQRRKTVARPVVVNYALCHFCGACVGACPENSISLQHVHLSIDPQTCTGCARCVRACPVQALSSPAGQGEGER